MDFASIRSPEFGGVFGFALGLVFLAFIACYNRLLRGEGDVMGRSGQRQARSGQRQGSRE